jgi:hypothetical protein
MHHEHAALSWSPREQQWIGRNHMDTALIVGTTVPDFDKNISAWLQKARHHHPDDPSAVVTIGIRNHDHHIYRCITARGKGQHFDAITFFNEAGFSALPVDFAKESGLDYVFHHADW